MFNESLSSEELPPTLQQAAITLIPKKGKDPLQCASYRPISLLNGDYKILSKIQAARLSIELNGTTCFLCSSNLDLVKLLYPG